MKKSATNGRFHKIRRLEVSGGFLDGLDVAFDPHLDCVIGGRGTGKTTVLEFLRFALGSMPDAQRATARHRRIEKLVGGNLGTGRIRVEIETRDGLVYHVERSAGDQPEVFDADNRPTPLSLEHGAIFDAEFYSQDEIEEIANSPSFQLDLIDKFIDGDIREIDQRLRTVTRELSANGTDLVRISGEIDELSEGLAELDVIAEKLKAFRSEGGKKAEELNREVMLKGLRDKERRAVEGLRGYVGSFREAAEELASAFTDQGARYLAADILEGPNAPVFEQAAVALQTCSEAVATLLRSTVEKVDHCLDELENQAAALGERHLEQEQRYRVVVEKHEKEKGRAHQRTQLQRRQNELMERKRDLDVRRETLQATRERRQQLIRELSELRDRRTELRQGVVARLNEELAPDIRVSVTQFGDSSCYRDLVAQALKGSGRRYNRLAESIVSTVPPQDFARMVATSAINELIDHLDLDAERAGWVVQQLQGTALLHEIEVVEMQDVPRIELKDGRDYKDSSSLSTGQKCTTILPILLLESEKPLLIDQPEDNLDNAFIFNTVVRRIREVKKHRQLIFVTHNPNIPVLGDAGCVLVMSSTGRRASLAASGTVDDVKGHVETILEGGREAFEARKRRYGH